MQNPFEEQQTALLLRTMGNVEKLSEAMSELIASLESINHYNLKVSRLNQAIQNYALNVKYNLQNQDSDQSNQHVDSGGDVDPSVLD